MKLSPLSGGKRSKESHIPHSWQMYMRPHSLGAARQRQGHGMVWLLLLRYKPAQILLSSLWRGMMSGRGQHMPFSRPCDTTSGLPIPSHLVSLDTFSLGDHSCLLKNLSHLQVIQLHHQTWWVFSITVEPTAMFSSHRVLSPSWYNCGCPFKISGCWMTVPSATDR